MAAGTCTKIHKTKRNNGNPPFLYLSYLNNALKNDSVWTSQVNLLHIAQKCPSKGFPTCTAYNTTSILRPIRSNVSLHDAVMSVSSKQRLCFELVELSAPGYDYFSKTKKVFRGVLLFPSNSL